MQKNYLARINKITKQEQPLPAHLGESAALAKSFAAKAGLGLAGELLGLAHDLGKYADEFQQKLHGANIKYDHAAFGAQTLARLETCFSNNPQKGRLKAALQMLALTVMSHHGGLIDVVDSEGTHRYLKRLNQENDYKNQQNINVRGANIIAEVKKILESLQFQTALSRAMGELNCFPDKNQCKEELLFMEGLLIKFLYSVLIDADRTNAIEFDLGEKIKEPIAEWETLIKATDKKAAGFPLNDLNQIRRNIYNTCKTKGTSPQGFFKLAVPTGGGKTLASFRFALEHAKKHNLERIIYVLPYISIIEQNAGFVREILFADRIDPQILLESHSNIIKNQEKDEDSKHYALTDNWNGQIIFTTMVQFLESVFAGGTQNIRRMHNMARAVIVFDEIQSLPIKCVHMANMLMKFLVNICQSTVVLCSATQPLLAQLENKNRSLNQAENIVEEVYPSLERVEIIDKTSPGGYETEEIKNMLLEELIKVKSVLVIVNTRKSALDLYNLVSQSPVGAQIFYLSTYLCAEHRSQIIAKIKVCLKNKTPLICLSTQLIEAGVDLDFNCVFRYLAGLDSIIQAAGRCNREGSLKGSNGQLAKGKVYLINSKNENIDRLKDIYEGQQVTKRLLGEIKKGCHENNLLSLSAINRYYECYFFGRKGEMDYNISACGADTNLFNLMSQNEAALAEYERIGGKKNTFRIRQAFKMVGENFKLIDDNQIGVIVPYRDGCQLIATLDTLPKNKILKKCQRYTVNLFAHELKEGFVHLSQSGVYYLNENYYDENLGVITEKLPVKEFEGGIF